MTKSRLPDSLLYLPLPRVCTGVPVDLHENHAGKCLGILCNASMSTTPAMLFPYIHGKTPTLGPESTSLLSDCSSADS